MESNCSMINIHLYELNGSLKHVWINNVTPIKVFQAFYHQQIKCLISGGNIIDENQTYPQLGLTNDALIIVILNNQRFSDSIQEKWLTQSSKIDLLTSEMKLWSNPKNRHEVCRLKDLRLMKFENKRSHKKYKLNSRSQDQQFDEPLKMPDDLKITCDSSIQESPLPFLFS